MRVIAKRTLKLFWEKHNQAEAPLRTWYSVASRARWQSPQDVKAMFGATVDFVGDNRIVFDLAGNKYRLVVRVSYSFQRVLIKFIGTHDEYDKIDAETV